MFVFLAVVCFLWMALVFWFEWYLKANFTHNERFEVLSKLDDG